MSHYGISEDGQIFPLPTVDIGGTSTNVAATASWGTWIDVADFDRITAILKLGTWNTSDDVDTAKLQQAQDASGTGVKDLTTSASGGNYDTDTPVDAAGDEVIFEARADQLDVDNGFRYVRLYASEGGNTGVDEVYGCVILHNARHGYAERHGAASASRQYVTPTVS